MKKNLCFAITQLQSALRKVSGNWLPGLVWLLLFSVPAVAQTKKITGKITDEQNKPLEGVSISVRPTGSGTTTNAEGEFTLNVPASAETLVFSAVGYLEKEMTIANNTTINVTLKKDVAGLNEVVVVGYGTQKKGNLTGSVSVIGSQQIERRPNTSTSNALQGLAPGVTVTSQTGSPGGDGGQIRIRGINSFGGSSSNPLVIIDGVAGSIDDIDVNLIESVSVLKDAASSAIYGSRAANGVILITTKRAKDKLSVNYRGFVGKQSPTDIPKVTDGLTYMKVFNDASMNDNNIKIYSDEDIEEFRKKYEANPKNYDWQDAILDGSGLMQNHFISLMANSGIVRVNPSFSYTDQEGIIRNTNFKRYIFRNNLDITPNKQWNIKADVSVTNRNRKQIADEGTIWNYLGRMPTNIPIRYGDKWSDGWVKINPVGYIQDGGNRKTNNLEFYGNLSVNFKPVDWLSLTGMFAPRYLTSNVHTFRKSVPTYYEDGSDAGAANTFTELTESAIRYFYGTYQFQATAQKSFGDHNFSLMAGTSRETYDEKLLSGYRRDFVYDNYEQLTAGADDATKDNNGTQNQWILISGFGRFNYDFNGKYLFEANMRYDGTSRFAGDNRWAAFPSFSAGWVVSKEDFWDKFSPVVNMLKIRGSWGKLGNQNIGNSYYPFAEALSLSSVSMGGNIYQMITQTTLSNPNLRWEETEMKGIGFDANLFNKFSVTFDYYDKRTDGILLKLNTSQLTGLASPYQNAAVVSNKGWEVSARYDNRWGDFQFGVGFNLSDVKNKIIDMKGQTSGDLLRQQEGYSINSIYGYIADGLYQSQEEINNGPTQIGTLKPGDVRYKDIAGATGPDGKPAPDGKITDADKVIIGSTIPRYTYGGNLDLGWKGFRLSAFVQGVGKVDGYLNSHYVIPAANSSAIKPWQLDYWTPENTDAALPRVSVTSTNNTQNSTLWMRSAAYLRLKNVQLGYEIPQTILKKVGIQKAFIYVNGQNIFTKTNFYEGYDPEINFDAGASDGVALGGGNFYPQVKVFTFGIDIKF
ncbi:SusC/RagA family TonB-linked outer membrane protein [Pseudobacter ginsenosidimutans]|uniref:TonB-linked SusC/RagA family outer membrane protein n=1 Tax=Pseudobacter ginsenosidimutans TaxID=661488 RepID=A0A4Q7MUQ2_9BACT|nr:TonB-dependent receptor [Pseudobacter ginsenosidimutans]QEC41518.1 TonB-dependent receptor [Pseudobacter ginsenosidimutans]RZS71699.1 TonB-linked SusC/RagA family outer membrane protein [Pseudobacter ginsenosidimutans]